VRDNIALGRIAGLAGADPVRQVFARRRDAGDVETAVCHAVSACGLGAVVDESARALSTGQRRLVELARVMAGEFTMLMLDEPSSGLDHTETSRFGDVLQALVADRGLGIVLVEHDMGLVMDVCDHVYVLDFGELIFDGPPDAVRSNDAVRAAYLGDLDVPDAG
jgi:ABC-type branched-subunit amino acid transport system ATPase component